MTTPAEKMGLVVGQSYLYQSNGKGYDDLDGTLVTFRNDDGTDLPAFHVPKTVDSDGWAYLNLDYITIPAPAVASGGEVTKFMVEVSDVTLIRINKQLTAAEVAKVLEAAGVV
jgi:hypothetical protein